jgi:hypothetical protein
MQIIPLEIVVELAHFNPGASHRHNVFAIFSVPGLRHQGDAGRSSY